MNYEDPELINRLSAEYVLGTLRGRARQRFQRLMLSSRRVREATWQWEQHLNQIGTAVTAVPPDPEVWEKISQRIEPVSSQEMEPVTIKPLKTEPVKLMPVFARMWQAIGITATAASLVLAVYLLQTAFQLTQPPESEQFAVVQNQQQQVLWLIDVSQEQLNIKVSPSVTAYSDKDYELWMILKGQDNPVSLGLLPKTGSRILMKKTQFNADDISLLAVSLEPLGGSPTGAPTQVLYTTPLISL